jgi:predicted RNA-binding Zn-ribbon protein involved in translation (DUF1610 family)
MSYESSLAAGWERYSDDVYEHEIDVEDACEACDTQVPDGFTAVAELDASDGWARWTCPECGAENGFRVNYGYRDIAEDRYYDL